MDREDQLVQARQEEAQALYRVGQATKERADRVLGFGVSATGVAAAAGIANDFEQVMLAVPTALSLLLAYVFQLYSDLIAVGIARARVEEVLAEQLREEALIAESIAPVRHGGRTNPSIPLTQAVYVALVAGSAIAGGIIARGVGGLAFVIYAAITLLAVAAVLLSWRDMGRTWGHAKDRVRDWPRRTGRLPL